MKTGLVVRYSKDYRKRNQLRMLFLGLAGVVTIGAVARLTALTPLMGITLAVIALVVALVCRWPVVGYFLCVAIVLPCEIFANPDGISPYTILPLTNLSFYTPLPVSATPLELIMALTILAAFVRASLQGVPFIDRSLTAKAVALLGGFLVYGYIWGVYIKHGDAKTAQWEIRALFYVIIMYFLTLHFMRGKTAWKVFSWLIPVGLTLLAALQIWRLLVLKDAPGETFYSESINGYNHETAILFVVLVMWAFAKLIFGGTVPEKLVAWALIPLSFVCIFTSGRRGAFAVLAVCVVLLLATLSIRHRRAFIISVIILSLTVPPYMVAFSKDPGPLGSAARAFSSTSAPVGSRDYNSDLFRLVEKSNVQMTIKTAPVTGIGFGQPYIRFIYFIDLDGFALQDYTAHVQVLWLWLKLGAIGWATFWFLICFSLFKLGQIIKYDKFGNQMTVCFTAGCILGTVMVYSYLDLGLINTRLLTLVGVAIGLLEVAYRTLKRPAPAPAEKPGQKLLDKAGVKPAIEVEKVKEKVKELVASK